MKEIFQKITNRKINQDEKVKKIVGNIEEKFNAAEGEEVATKQAVEEAIKKLEKTPGLSEAVLRELLVRKDISNAIPVETIKNIPESGIPNDTLVEVVEKLSDELPDNKVLEIAEETNLGLQKKQKIFEAVSDPETKRKKQEELLIRELDKIYMNISSEQGEFEILENINRVLQVNPDLDSEKMKSLIDRILVKKMVLNYMNFNITMPRKFAELKSVEEMFSEDFPKIAEYEYKKMPRIDREEAKFQFEGMKFKEDLLIEMAKNIAENYKKNGFKRLVIPQSKSMREINKEEEEKFIENIMKEVERKGGTLNTISIIDAKGQIKGNIEESEKIKEYVTKIEELPQKAKTEFIEQGKKIITDQDLLNISNYCNKVGLYQSLAELGQTQAEKVVDSFIEIIEKRKQMKENKSKKIAPKEEIPKVKAAKFIDER